MKIDRGQRVRITKAPPGLPLALGKTGVVKQLHMMGVVHVLMDDSGLVLGVPEEDLVVVGA